MKRQDVNRILHMLLDEHPTLSDINFTVGKPIQAEVDGVLRPACADLRLGVLTPYHTEHIALALIGPDRRLIRNLLDSGSCDFSYALEARARFRGNVFSQRGYYSVVMRVLPSRVMSIDELELPAVFKRIAEERNGIVFVTGATGSGKTTSLAAILNEINRSKSVHVVTLEDPVEFVHPQLKATFNQRELGQDFDTFANGLRAALRQAPKVILVGEMRDRETVEIGLSAAETGHLVLTTLHTIDASHTVNRIVGMFELEEERLIRIRLADAMRWTVSQRLLPKVGGGRVAAFEIMGNNLRVRESIIHGEREGKTFYEMMQQSRPFGWTTFDDSIVSLYERGLITEETALGYASNRAEVKRGVDRIKAARGEKTTDIEGLGIDQDYSRKFA
ncbi:MAG: type IV pilus twitching motility protein PilT [Desulfosoma sp.]|uniref:type IV pilus twitching motility protein PilT n=1 Tax=Desulfosoma sp. TaxID=2603217 RepID=UPI00404B9726